MFVSVSGNKHNLDLSKHTTKYISRRLLRPHYNTVVSSVRVLQPNPQKRRGLVNVSVNTSI